MTESTIFIAGVDKTKSKTRTSRSTWLSRSTSDITASLFQRAEDLLNVPINDMTTEDMQVSVYCMLGYCMVLLTCCLIGLDNTLRCGAGF